jgi:hypothetical protein
MIRTAWVLLLALLVNAVSEAAEPSQPASLPAPSRIKPTMYCTGFAFAEGPAIDRDGNLYVVNDRERAAPRHSRLALQ